MKEPRGINRYVEKIPPPPPETGAGKYLDLGGGKKYPLLGVMGPCGFIIQTRDGPWAVLILNEGRPWGRPMKKKELIHALAK